MRIRRLPRRRHERSPGQSLAEFAIILPVFLVILSAAIDLGRIAYARVSVANVAREASFQAAQTPTSYQAGQPCPTADPVTGDVPETNLVVCRAILESTGSVVTVSPSDIALTCSPSCAEAMGNTVTVKVTGQFNLLTPVMAALLGGTSVRFSSSSTNQITALPESSASAPTEAPTAAPTGTPAPTDTPPPACTLPSAGFTYVATPTSNQSPVTVTVTDTSSAAASCGITQWAWDWGDGHSTTFGQVQAPHVYDNTTGKKGDAKTFNLMLTVTNLAGSSTSGAATITVIRP